MAGGDDSDGVFGNRDHFFAAQFNAGVLFDGAGDFASEHVAVYGERVAARHTCLLGQAQQQGIQAPQFLFEQPGRGIFRFAL